LYVSFVNSLGLAGWQSRKTLTAGPAGGLHGRLRRGGERGSGRVCGGVWGRRFPTIVKMWRAAWQQVIPFFAFPPEVRRVIDTTNAFESIHARVRKVIKTRGQVIRSLHFRGP